MDTGNKGDMKGDLIDNIKKSQSAILRIDPPFPRNMLLEVTNMCNHNCIFCAHSKSTRKPGKIDEQLAKRILKDAFEGGVREVGFYCCGEPLVDVNLEKYISYAKSLGYEYTYITTNGALFHEKRMVSLVDSGIDSIKFSINAASKETYLLTHDRDDYETVYENLKRLYKYRKNMGGKYKIFVSCILSRYTIDEKEAFYSRYAAYCDELVFFNCINQGGVMPEIEGLLTIDGTDTSGAGLGNGQCFMPFNKLNVSYEGYLTICCTDFQNYLVVSDLNQESIQDAWNNERFREVRRKFLAHDFEGMLCKNCLRNSIYEIEPIWKEVATEIDIKQWTKKDEICSRLDKNR